LLGSLLFVAAVPQLWGQEPDTTATVRAVHMVSDGPKVDLYLDDISPAVFGNVEYRSATRAVRIQPGAHNVKITAAGTPKEAAVIDTDVDFGPDSAYAVVATGSLLAIDVQAVTLSRKADRRPAPGSSFLRVLHASTGASELDVRVKDVADVDHLIENVGYRTASDFITVPTGNARFDLTEPNGDTIYSASGIIPEGVVITLIAEGNPSEGTFRLHVLLETDSTGRTPMDTLRAIRTVSDGTIRLTHVATDISGPVDLYIDDATVPEVAGLRRLAASRHLVLAGGVHTFKVTKAGESAASPLLSREVEVIAGLYRSMVLIGSDSSSTLDFVTLTASPTSEPPPGKASVRFLNAREDSSVYDVDIDFSGGGTRSILSSGFGNFTSYESANAGKATVTVEEQADNPMMLKFTGDLPADATSTLIFVYDGADPALYRLGDSDPALQDVMAPFSIVSAVRDQTVPKGSVVARHDAFSDYIEVTYHDLSLRSVSVRLHALDGRTVRATNRETSFGTGRITIDAATLPSGVYVVELAGGPGSAVWTGTVVVAH
jgi:hypothetical protein